MDAIYAMLFVALFMVANAHEPKSKKTEPKSILTINTVAGVPSIIKATIEKKAKQRVKRNSQKCSVPFCISEMDRFHNKLDDRLSYNGVVDDQLGQFLHQYCSTFKSAVGCVDGCGKSIEDLKTHPITQNWIKTAIYVCIDTQEDLESNVNCMASVSGRLDNECAPKCGPQDFLQTQITVIKETEQFEAPFSNICGFIKCVQECAPPIFEAECEKKSAQQITERFTQLLFKMGEIEFNKDGLPFAERCSQLANPDKDFPNLKPWDPENPEPFPAMKLKPARRIDPVERMMQMQTQVLKQQLQVLEKQKVKLELEIEVIKMRKN